MQIQRKQPFFLGYIPHLIHLLQKFRTLLKYSSHRLWPCHTNVCSSHCRLPNPFTGTPNKLERRSGQDLDTQFPLRISETAADERTKWRKGAESRITPNAIRSETNAPSEWKNPAKRGAIWRGLRDRPPGSEESTWTPCLPPFPPPPPPIATLECDNETFA